TAGIWHVFVPGVVAGQRYEYRMRAHDASKLVLDPYVRQVDRTDYDLGAASTPRVDTAGRAPLGNVTAPGTAVWAGAGVPWEHTVIYEGHVKGATMRHPGIPPHLRGSYLGLGHPAMIEHLTSLGVTTVQLLP